MNTDTSNTQTTNWGIVSVTIAAGIIAGIQVGKIPPTLPALRAELGIGLITAGWIASILNLMGAALGIASGLFSDWKGARNSLVIGITMLLLGALAGVFSSTGTELIGARAIAGLGLMTISVAGPRFIVAVTRPKDLGLVFGAWSGYMPAGMALAMIAVPFIIEYSGWRGVWIVDSGLILAFLILFILTTRQPHPEKRTKFHQQDNWKHIRQAFSVPGPWLLGGIFGCYTLLFFAVMNWLPTFLIETQGYSTPTAAFTVSLVVAINVFGNLGGGWLMHHGFSRWMLQLIALVFMGFSTIGIFANLVPISWKIVLAFLFSLVGGLQPPATLAGAPVHSPTPAHVSTVNGFIVQGSNLGSLAGPPLMAAIVGAINGWNGSWQFLVVFAAVGSLLVLILRRIEK